MYFMLLSFVLHVPEFSENLLSIGSLTNSFSCFITFSSNHCVFQFGGQGKLFGMVIHGGLYLLEIEISTEMTS